MLLDIRDTVADYAELIARVVGVDVEVVDAGLNRLAGTGLYASGVGENIRAEGETYRHVMRIRRSFVMEAPREHFICTRCPGRDLCRETLSISTPIIDGSDVLGVIGLVCSTDEDRARVLEHKDVYVQFIERCAEFILHKLHDHADLLRARSFLDIMLRILEINSRGIVIFNAKGGISYLNDIARRDLGLKDDGLPTDVQFKRTGESFSDLEEFVVTARSRKHTLMGQMTPLVPSDYHFATVFTFESLPRMADRVSSLGDSLSGVENLIGRSPAMLQLKDQHGIIQNEQRQNQKFHMGKPLFISCINKRYSGAYEKIRRSCHSHGVSSALSPLCGRGGQVRPSFMVYVCGPVPVPLYGALQPHRILRRRLSADEARPGFLRSLASPFRKRLLHPHFRAPLRLPHGGKDLRGFCPGGKALRPGGPLPHGHMQSSKPHVPAGLCLSVF